MCQRKAGSRGLRIAYPYPLQMISEMSNPLQSVATHSAERGPNSAGVGAPSRKHGSLYRAIPLIWLFALAFAFMLPTIIHGSVFAPFDILNNFGLGRHSTMMMHNSIDSDLIRQDVPWLKLEWTQIHSGSLPFWNPFSGEGMPLGLDFITAAFSLPTVLTFAFPVQDALLVSVLAKLFIAGSGAYFFGRVIGLSRLSATLVGTIFEFSGAFTVWLGWSQTGVMAWLGWIFAAVLLTIRGHRRFRSVILLTHFWNICSRWSSRKYGHSRYIYFSFAVVVLAGQLLQRVEWRLVVRTSHRPNLGNCCRPRTVCTFWLPATQLSTATARFQSGGIGALPARDMLNLMFQGYDGLPIGNSSYVNHANYYEITAFVGIIALALAVLASSVHWRRIECWHLLSFGDTAPRHLLSARSHPCREAPSWRRSGLVQGTDSDFFRHCLSCRESDLIFGLNHGALRSVQIRFGWIFGVFASCARRRWGLARLFDASASSHVSFAERRIVRSGRH